MKKRTLHNKLTFKKEIIANLENKQLNKIRGGISFPCSPSWDSYDDSYLTIACNTKTA